MNDECPVCLTRRRHLALSESDLGAAARRAAANDSPRNLAGVSRARAERDKSRAQRDDHASTCTYAGQEAS